MERVDTDLYCCSCIHIHIALECLEFIVMIYLKLLEM